MELADNELAAAAGAVDRLDALFRRAAAAGIDPSGAPLDEPTVERFRAAMDDDFGTPAAVAAIFDAVGAANAAIDGDDAPRAASLVATVGELVGVLGIDPGAAAAEPDERDRRAGRGARCRARRQGFRRGRPDPRRARRARRHARGHAERHHLAPLVNPRGGAEPARSRPPRESLGAEQVEGRARGA